MRNDAAEEAKFLVNVNQAYTSPEGLIDYVNGDVTPDKSLKYPISEIVTAPKKIVVPANSTKEVTLQINMPKEKFDGRMMAGIQVLKLMEEDGATVTSQFGYVLGLQLRNTVTQIKRDLKASHAKAAVSFGETSFSVNVQNPTMDAIGKMTFQGKVTKAGKKAAIQKVDLKDRSMAPNSNFDLIFDMNDKEITPGNYELHLKVTDGKGNVWEFTEPFTVSKEAAEKVNSVIIPVAGNFQTPPWFYWLVGALAALLVLVIGVLIKSRRPQGKEAVKELNV